jgi:glycosyltransferase involved in cell wall biosynthesis
VVIVPCFNEEKRLDCQAFLALGESGEVRLLFVDDGSTDGTGVALDRLARASAGIDVLSLPRNMGKAEAVRLGCLRAIADGAPIVGYFDADLATPGPELLRMVRTLDARPDLAAVFGSRVARLGSHIERSPFRHYTGRVFATAASWALEVAVYDTQCGSKVFRVNPTLMAAFEIPFRSTWSFDVQLCQRLFDGTAALPGLPFDAFLELPLEAWQDVAGSKVNIFGSLVALGDVVVIGMERRLRRRRHGGVEHHGTDRSVTT